MRGNIPPPPGPASFSGPLPRPISWAEGGGLEIGEIRVADVSPVLRESGRDGGMEGRLSSGPSGLGGRVSEGSSEVVRGPQVVVTVAKPGTGGEGSVEGRRGEESEAGRSLGINRTAEPRLRGGQG
jgi:hypothetical protein